LHYYIVIYLVWAAALGYSIKDASVWDPEIQADIERRRHRS